MKQNNVKFRKVKEKDLYEIFNLFKKVFTLNISKNTMMKDNYKKK